ncbi:insulinase family protein [Chromatiaceae bacterium AAb-1]|nr:insulinase family protein [Chromatiaceae bacterium AAb-1]
MENVQILQSPNDPRHYHYLKLDNGLPVLLVHQADSEKSAAALTVNVGHFDDPCDRQGLAHFLEHMLFLGSARYPEAGAWQHFINHHGGSNNAWTGTEHSNFFFDIDTRFFEQGLARFADMLSQPLFHADYIEKERHAIEAEFSLKLKDDSRRIYQVHKETINPEHPFTKFSVGNLSTLKDTDDATLQQAVQQFYKQQYSTSRMTLVLVSSLPVKKLQQFAEKYFNALSDHLPAKPPLAPPLYLPEHKALQLNIRPHKDTCKLVASFALPDIQPWYQYKVVSFIAHLLGDEGDGSLLSILKQQGLANQLSAGGGIDGSNYKDFTIAFELTDKGLAERDTILTTLFRQLALLKQQPLPQALFAERQKLLSWSFLYQEPATALQTASHLAVNMQHYPPEDIIWGDYRMELPPESLYQQILALFRPDNLRLMLIAPGVKTDKQARWYHTPYSIEQLPAALLQQLTSLTPAAGQQLPPRNPYLEDELTLLAPEQHMPQTERLYQDPHLTLWYKADTDFNSPKGHIFIQFTLPNSITDNLQLAATRLWTELFQDQINQRLYAATTANLSYHLHVQKQGFSLHTCGLTANQLHLLQDLLQQLTQQQFQEERFNELKRQLCRHWLNSSKNKPVARLFSQLSALLQPQNPEIEHLAAALDALTFSDFCRFSQQLFQRVHIESLIIGNWHAYEARTLQQLLQQWLHHNDSSGTELSPLTYSMLDQGPVWMHVDTDHNDHALVIYLPARDKTPESMAKFMLANHVMSPQYFHQLRTEQQLGYLVGTGYVPVNTLPGMAFYIQSPDTRCEPLYQSTVMFFRGFLADTENLTPEEFHEIKLGLLSQIKERDNSLGARAKRYWLAIGQRDYHVCLNEKVAAALTALTLQDFTVFLHQLLLPSYDAIFLATDGIPPHSHLRFVTPQKLKELLISFEIGFDSKDKLI